MPHNDPCHVVLNGIPDQGGGQGPHPGQRQFLKPGIHPLDQLADGLPEGLLLLGQLPSGQYEADHQQITTQPFGNLLPPADMQRTVPMILRRNQNPLRCAGRADKPQLLPVLLQRVVDSFRHQPQGHLPQYSQIPFAG
ncbi:hypothetical protein D3C75_714030 [compost metagenome]